MYGRYPYRLFYIILIEYVARRVITELEINLFLAFVDRKIEISVGKAVAKPVRSHGVSIRRRRGTDFIDLNKA